MATPVPFVYFASGMGQPYCRLSNFFAADIELRESDVNAALLRVQPLLADFVRQSGGTCRFPCVEHLWQALKAMDKTTFDRFCSGGNLTVWSPDLFARTVVPKKLQAKLRKLHKNPPVKKDTPLPTIASVSIENVKYWQRNNMIGILSKIAANEEYAVALNLTGGRMAYHRERLTPSDEQAVWLTLLRLKYTQHPDLRALLCGTGTKRLVEFVKGAAQKNGATRAHWGGVIDKLSGNVLGENVMGRYMEETRRLLCSIDSV